MDSGVSVETGSPSGRSWAWPCASLFDIAFGVSGGFAPHRWRDFFERVETADSVQSRGRMKQKEPDLQDWTLAEAGLIGLCLLLLFFFFSRRRIPVVSDSPVLAAEVLLPGFKSWSPIAS